MHKTLVKTLNLYQSEWLILYINSDGYLIFNHNIMSQLIRVTKEFPFEMAHVLWNYDGPCKNVHGHSYRLFVTLSGYPSDDPLNPKNGMVIDFSDLKKIVKKGDSQHF